MSGQGFLGKCIEFPCSCIFFEALIPALIVEFQEPGAEFGKLIGRKVTDFPLERFDFHGVFL